MVCDHQTIRFVTRVDVVGDQYPGTVRLCRCIDCGERVVAIEGDGENGRVSDAQPEEATGLQALFG